MGVNTILSREVPFYEKNRTLRKRGGKSVRERACTVIAVKHLTEKYGGTLVASQEKYILIIPKQNRSNSQTKPLYDTDNK